MFSPDDLGGLKLIRRQNRIMCPMKKRSCYDISWSPHLVRALNGKVCQNRAFWYTNMKLGTPRQFDTLKKIGPGPHLKIAPKCYF